MSCDGMVAIREERRVPVTSVSNECIVFCFFEQKTAYEMLGSLVGSEMCIRDSPRGDRPRGHWQHARRPERARAVGLLQPRRRDPRACLLYTSDAADDLLCVDIGGRRIIKKKKTILTCLS